MHILHLISSRGFYGAENVVLNLGKALKIDHHIPYVACLNGLGKSAPEIYSRAQKEGMRSEIITCRHKFDFKALSTLNRLIKEERIDIIHSHGYKSNLYGLIASKLSGVPIMATLHGWTGEDKKIRLYEKLDKWIIKKIDHLVSVSPSMSKELEKIGISNGEVTFIPNAIDTDRFNSLNAKDNVCQELGIPENSVVIGTVGRLNYEKGHIYLIRAIKDICYQMPKVKLLIVGDGHLKENLKKEAQDLGIGKNVLFTGARKDIVSVYKSMDIVVLPSLTEGSPLVLLEAMSMGLPVIATRVGGIPSVVEKGVGILVSPASDEELKKAILFLLKDSSLRNTMGERARQKIVSQYSIDTFYKKYTDLYSLIIKNNADN